VVKERYADFGPTLACEKLREQHDLVVSVENAAPVDGRRGAVADAQAATKASAAAEAPASVSG
jgi:hypothetical protein